ncbi:MAG TPA: glycoside hydrolase family 2 TIM barrel-domain containing protein [Chloroflexota bacterium]|nr:glycoside hydrolase family 2 TIM barrel-domain containing protein [Chloroflexota bacterium]
MSTDRETPVGHRQLGLLLTLLVALLCLQGGPVTASPPPQRGPRLDRVSWLDGDWFLLGYNYPWYDYNQDFLPDSPQNVRANYARIDTQLADLRANGTHVTRWYVFNDAAAYPEFDAQGRVTGLSPQFLQQFDDAVALASAHGIYLIPVLLDGTPLTQRTNRAARPRVLTDPVVRQTFLERAVRPLVERYGQHPAILAWSVLNEPEDFTAELNAQPERLRIPQAQVAAYIAEAAQLIHRYARQPVALDTGLRWVSAWQGLGLDLYLAHWYPWMAQYWPEFSPYSRPASTLGVDRPVVIGEFATANTPYSLTESLDRFYANGYAGALAWSYTNNADRWADYAGTHDALRAWEQAHLAEVDIRPPDDRLGVAAREPRVLADWETAADREGWTLEWGGGRGLRQTDRQARQGGGALAVRATLAGPGWRDVAIARWFASPQDLSYGSNTLRSWVWLPPEAPQALYGQVGVIDAQRRVQLGPEIPLAPGSWTTVLWASAPLAGVWGLVIAVGGHDPRFTGDLLVDYLTVQ